MINHFSQEEFEGTFHIKDADLQKMAKVLNDVNIKECPYFDLSDKYGNSARYYRENQWIPCSERLPEDGIPVNITWVNRKPLSYYIDIKDKPFTATGIYYRGQWYWYSCVCEDLLYEYGRSESDAVDNDVEITAWMPLPESYKEGEE